LKVSIKKLLDNTKNTAIEVMVLSCALQVFPELTPDIVKKIESISECLWETGIKNTNNLLQGTAGNCYALHRTFCMYKNISHDERHDQRGDEYKKLA
jgi:hypothetical protein